MSIRLGIASVAFLAIPTSFVAAEVRVAHLSPDTPAVNVRIGPAGGMQTTPIMGLEYLSLAPAPQPAYLPVPTGNYDIDVDAPSLGPAGISAINVDNLALDGNTSYTVAAVGTLDGLLNPNPGTSALQPLLLIDDNTLDPANARVRFVHASADTPAVDIVANGSLTLFDNVGRFESGGYVTVAPGSYDLAVFLESQNQTGTPALSLPGVSVEAGAVYTIFAVGLSGLGQTPAAGQELGALAVVDAVIPEPTIMGLAGALGLMALRRRR